MVQLGKSEYRNELKYTISLAQMQVLQSRIMGLMERDAHVGESGKYNIRSLYFDDYFNSGYYDNINGNDHRRKYRIRIYNHSKDEIHLECKEKVRGKTKKRMCSLTEEQAYMLIQGEPIGQIAEQKPVLQELSKEMLTHLMRPKIIVEYERMPFVYANGNVRVTFDTNLRSSKQIANFFDEDLSGRAVFPQGMHLLEVKYDEYLPDWIRRALQLEELRQTAFSKYCHCRKFTT